MCNFGFYFHVAVAEIIGTMKNGSVAYPTYFSGPDSATVDLSFDSTNLDANLKTLSPDALPKEIQDSLSFKDNLMYIYTSGTTGMPKAAIIKHSR